MGFGFGSGLGLKGRCFSWSLLLGIGMGSGIFNLGQLIFNLECEGNSHEESGKKKSTNKKRKIGLEPIYLSLSIFVCVECMKLPSH